MVPVLLIVTALFGFLFLTRMGGVHRKRLLERWPAVLLAGAAIFFVLRGSIWNGVALGTWAAFMWGAWPAIEQRLRRQPPSPPQDSPEDSAARRLLGVGPNATAGEIRSAYRTKMAHAHPDRGGSHDEAARLTAARDRLLKKR